MSDKRKARLVLEDGSTFEGFSFGAPAPASGEVVFNTAMTGYPESLTDPSYCGQILVITYPLVGNYGVPQKTLEYGLLKYFESDRIHVTGVVIADYSFEYSHWNAAQSLSDWLCEQNVPGLYGVDTRAITKLIRERGVMLGKLCVEGEAEPAAFTDPNLDNLVARVSTPDVQTYGDGALKVVLADCGCKYNIIRSLLKRGATVCRVPWDYDFTQIDYDGLMLSNGPGDPQQCGATIENIRKAMELGKPIFGICLGNQLLSIAAGGSTSKLKYGHRSHNQPALHVGTNRAVITSQNHGYVVDGDSLDSTQWEPYFVNLNDGSNEGIRHRTKPFCSVQFHPEASSGPVDTEFLFDDFITAIQQSKNK